MRETQVMINSDEVARKTGSKTDTITRVYSQKQI
jgi:hypothetical protein